MISRREFIRGAASTFATLRLADRVVTGIVPSGVVHAATATRPLMYVGTQGSAAEGMLRFYKRCGVNNVCGDPDRWSLEGLLELKERCAANGIAVDMVPLGMPRSVGLLGDASHRDEEIEQTCQQIRMVAEAGIPAIKYNLSVLDVLRTGTTSGRGGSRYSTWVYEDAGKGRVLTNVGQFPAELYWERITHFLERAIPVATENKVKMACHPHDPGLPPEGYRGVQQVMGTVEGLKRFIDLSPSPYHGLNFCVGTVASSLRNPSSEIFDVIRYFGQRGRVFNVHFRNIRGHCDDFREVYPDEGDIDMHQVMKVLKEVGYTGMVMPDHMPTLAEDPGQLQGFAFAFGYIKALIEAVHAGS
jgi:mannonate dehydratase